MSRRFLSLAVLLTLAGCSGAKDLFTAHSNVAAYAGSQELAPDRLAEILTGAKGAKLDRESADFVANTWTDYSLFAQSVATGKVLNDSSTAAAAMWPEIAELRTTRWHDSLLARRGGTGPDAIDQAYKGSDVRVFQHILFGVKPSATPEEKAVARKKADAVLAQVRKGGDFSKLAATNSADPGSARDGGFLPPSPKGAFVPTFDSAAWALPPGATSAVVESPYGYHIIRRPPLDAVRERLGLWLQQSSGAKFDSLYLDSLAIRNRVKVSSEAPKLMRAALQDVEGQSHSEKRLADFKDGGLTVREFLRWVRALPPQYLSQLKQSDDASLERFVKILSTNVLLLREADSAKVRLAPVEWQAMLQHYRAAIDTLRADMDIAGSDISDTQTPESDRVKIARMKVDKYFDDLIGGKKRLRPLPATLGAVLRERSKYGINQSGLNRSLELARAKQASDSTAAKHGEKPAHPGAPGAQPAPGPATPPPAGAPTTPKQPGK